MSRPMRKLRRARSCVMRLLAAERYAAKIPDTRLIRRIDGVLLEALKRLNKIEKGMGVKGTRLPKLKARLIDRWFEEGMVTKRERARLLNVWRTEK